MDQIKKIDNCILDFIFNERKNILFEKTQNLNLSKAFKGVGDFGEELTIYLFEKSIGSASKGGCAFDNIELNEINDINDDKTNEKKTKEIKIAREVKCCCQIQPKKCKKCTKKAPYFQELCLYCKSTDFDKVYDSRYGIDSKAQIQYNDYIKEYILIHIMYNDETNNVNLKVFKIKSDNEYFQGYIKNQYENSKSTTCNMLPNSYDFYLSGPILLLDYDVNDKNIITKNYFDLMNEKKVFIPASIFKKQEKIDLNIDLNAEYVLYDDMKHHFALRKKNLNKDRGVTTRL
jgi:hypothetical protein